MTKPQTPTPLGPHAGRMIVNLIAQTVAKSRGATIPAEMEHKRRMIEGMMDSWEGGIGEFAHEILAPMGQAPASPRWVTKMLVRAHKPQRQIDFILNLLVGLLGAAGVLFGAGRIVWQNLINDLYKDNQYVPLSPPDAADAVERNILTDAQGHGWAAQSGISEQVFELMVRLTGEPPGIVDMLRLWRRGDLDESLLDTMIAYSRIRTEWTPYVKKLAYDVLPAADVVDAYIKGHISEQEAESMYAAAGGKPSDFGLAALTAGSPIGVVEAAKLYNHGLISHADFRSVILSSRINPQFESMAELLHLNYLSAFQIETAVKAGTVSAKTASEWLIQDGYPADQVAALVSGSVATKVTKVKEAAESLILDSYEAGLLTKTQTVEQLEAIGYDPKAIPVILGSYDARRIITLTNQGVGVVRKSYLANRLTDAQAKTELDSLGVDPTLRDHYVTLWAIERQATGKSFTKAEVGDMLKKGIVTDKWAVSEWVSMGYSTAQAMLLGYYYGQPLPGNGPVV